MIYAASYSYPEHHHGALVPLTRRFPVRVWRRVASDFDRTKPPGTEQGRLLDPKRALSVDWLRPTPMLKEIYQTLGENAFIEAYRLQVWENLEGIREYLDSRDPAVDETWLTHAPPGAFSHRNLALKLVEKYRPACYGGADVPVFSQTNLLEPKS